MTSRSDPEGDEITRATLSGLREFSRMIGKRGPVITPQQLDEMIRATRTLLSALEFRRRLSAAN